MRIDLGCGRSKKKGYIGVDNIKYDDVDLIVNIEHGLPFKDDSVQEIYTSHFLEHVNDPKFSLSEIFRVLSFGGKATIIVPHFSNSYSYHWTHKTYWNYFSFDQWFGLTLYFDEPVDLIHKKIIFSDKYFPRPLNQVLEFFANWKPGIYEQFISNFIPAWELEFIIKK